MDVNVPGRSRRCALVTALCAAVAALLLRRGQRRRAGARRPRRTSASAMGADRQLAAADAIERYFELVAARSDRVRIVDIGPTTEGHRTSPPSSARRRTSGTSSQIRAANQRLADPRTLPPDEARRLAATHKVVLAIGGSIHASEIGATQAANELLYALATADRSGDARRAAERRRDPDSDAQSGRPSAGRRLVPEDARARRSKAGRCRGCITSTPATTSIATRS